MPYEQLNNEVDQTIALFLDKIRDIKGKILAMDNAREAGEKCQEMYDRRESYWKDSYFPMQEKIETAFAAKEISEEEVGSLTIKLMSSIKIYDELFQEAYRKIEGLSLEASRKLTEGVDNARKQCLADQAYLRTSHFRLHQPSPNQNPTASAEAPSCSLL